VSDHKITITTKVTHSFRWNKEPQFVGNEVAIEAAADVDRDELQAQATTQALKGLFDAVDEFRFNLEKGNY
jgi:hypothetical protein